MAGNKFHKHMDRLYRADQDQDNGDDFGLPSSGSSSGGGTPSKPTEKVKKPAPPPPKKSSGGAIVVVIIVVIVIAAFLLYWFVIRKPPVKKPVVMKPDTTMVQPKPDTVVQKPVEVKPEPVKPETGSIDTITARTGRYYVIISASIDNDLAHDYAMKLSKQGVNCKILGSPDKKGYHQLSVADFDSQSAATAKAEDLKSTYGNNVWVMKY